MRNAKIVRSVAYLGGAAAIVQGVGSLMQRTGSTNVLLTQSLLCGIGTAWTAGFLTQERRPLSPTPAVQRIKQLAQGAVFGTGAFGLFVALGQVSKGVNGTVLENSDGISGQTLQTVLQATLTHGLVAWNEELVFRGYGLDVTEAAFGHKAAALTLALFGLYHEWRWQVVFGEVALGAALLALRRASGGIWLPIGYHWAWNLVQTGIIGPTDGPPTPLTLQVHGPYWLIGRPGHPEPGLLTAAIHLGVAAFALACRGRQQPS